MPISVCCRRDNAQPRKREHKKRNFWGEVMLGVAWKALLKKGLKSLKANSFWKLSENRGSSNWGAQRVNTGGKAGAIGLSTELLASADREVSSATFSREPLPATPHAEQPAQFRLEFWIFILHHGISSLCIITSHTLYQLLVVLRFGRIERRQLLQISLHHLQQVLHHRTRAIRSFGILQFEFDELLALSNFALQEFELSFGLSHYWRGATTSSFTTNHVGGELGQIKEGEGQTRVK